MNLSNGAAHGRIVKVKRTAISPKLAQDVTEALGQVPIVRVNCLGHLCKQHELYLKLEACNPGGSLKEKNAAYLVKAAEAQGLLRSAGTIVESSSGNFGIGLAMVGAARGYRVIIVVDSTLAPPVRHILLAHGAELVQITDEDIATYGSAQRARMMRATTLSLQIPGAWNPCQHRNPQNPDAHTVFTARELEAAFHGAPDVIVAGISTAGQLMGLANHFRKRHPRTRFVGVDVSGSVILGTPAHPYRMIGMGLAFVPPNYDPRVLDAAYSITDQVAFSACFAIARREGLLLGGSTGAVVAAGLAYARTLQRRSTIAMINSDSGSRYVDTIYDPEWLRAQGIGILEWPSLEAEIEQLEPVPRDVVLSVKSVA